jgi:hypothetical protein
METKTKQSSKEDRLARFAKQLSRYSDAVKALQGHPLALPHTLEVKSPSGLTVGRMDMDWQATFGVVVDWAMSMAGVSADDDVDCFLAALDHLNKTKLPNPAFQTLGYVITNWPEKIDRAFRDLMLEARQAVGTGDAAKNGRSAPHPCHTARYIADSERRAIQSRMDAYGAKPKSSKGQHSKWTTDSLDTAINKAIKSLHRQPGTRLRPLEYNLLQSGLQRLYPKTAPRSGEALRKLIQRLNLTGVWKQHKDDWARQPPKRTVKK